ncbi:TetR/AcrR family transcriptional regulator [Hirschia litorea]|uniref:TetR/AcrR family transcriptional regulator n=1 Tax=Hirschia litorea TaxID=1199156 RepID=A0ABW2IJM7_9PROT
MSSASQILDIAERRMRQVGYNAVSYRDIAAEMGIKSASLHYHFPKKEDMGVALVRRYAENFQAALAQNTAKQMTAEEDIFAFVDNFRTALKEQNLVCLCAVLGAEAAGIPTSVADEVKTFFVANIEWLSSRYAQLGASAPLRQAKMTLSLLEGAMITSQVNGDESIFDAAVEFIHSSVPKS